MANKGTFFIVLSVLLLSGCLPKQQQLGIQTYLFSAPKIETPSQQATVNNQNAATKKKPNVKLTSFEAIPPFDSRFFIFKLAPTQYQRDYYHRFLSVPSTQLAAIMLSELKQTGNFSQVLDNNDAAHANYLMKFVLTRLYVDISDPKQPKAVIGLEVELTASEDGNASGRYTLDRRYVESVPIKDYHQDAKQIVLAWDQGLSKIVAKMSNDWRQLHQSSSVR